MGFKLGDQIPAGALKALALAEDRCVTGKTCLSKSEAMRIAGAATGQRTRMRHYKCGFSGASPHWHVGHKRGAVL